MGLEVSKEPYCCGPVLDLFLAAAGRERRSLFSIADWREWRRNRGSGAAVGVNCRYHVDQQLTTKYVLANKVLGTGMSGPVWLARGKAGTALEKREFAVKTIRKPSGPKLARVKSEVMIMLSTDHPNIARLEDVFDMPFKIYMVMELLKGEELFYRIKARGRYSEDAAVEAVRSMCEAVAYLHGQKPLIVHRDLKPENFVYERRDSSRLKLIDFGLSAMWDKRVDSAMRRVCGTPLYMAPEVIGRKAYTEKCDLFCLGTIAYILVTGCAPFKLDARELHYCSPFKSSGFRRVSPDGQSFIKSLLSCNPAERPSAEQCLGLPWLQRREGALAQGAGLDGAVLKSMRSFSNAPRFKRMCLSMIAWSLTAEDREHLRGCFVQMDRNCDGRISLSEMRTALEENFAIDSAEADELFRQLDDGDDEICYTDFLAIAMQESVRMHEDVLEAAFSRFDHGSKGFITAQDLGSMLGEDCEEGSAEEMLKELGKTGSDHISRREFMDYLTSRGEEEEEQQEEAGEVDPDAEALPSTPSRLDTSPETQQSKRKALLAARLIDGQRRRTRPPQGVGRFATFGAPSTREWDMPDPLQRLGEDARKPTTL